MDVAVRAAVVGKMPVDAAAVALALRTADAPDISEDVDNQKDFAFILGEIYFHALVAEGLQIVYLIHTATVLCTDREREERSQKCG